MWCDGKQCDVMAKSLLKLTMIISYKKWSKCPEIVKWDTAKIPGPMCMPCIDTLCYFAVNFITATGSALKLYCYMYWPLTLVWIAVLRVTQCYSCCSDVLSVGVSLKRFRYLYRVGSFFPYQNMSGLAWTWIITAALTNPGVNIWARLHQPLPGSVYNARTCLGLLGLGKMLGYIRGYMHVLVKPRTLVCTLVISSDGDFPHGYDSHES